MGKQPFKRDEEKDMLLISENLNNHTSKRLAKAGDRLVYLTQEKKVPQEGATGCGFWW